MIKGLDHVTIIVNDLDAAIEQYSTILGMEVSRRAEPNPARGYQPAVFSFGDTNIELITPTNDSGPWARSLEARGEGVYLVSLKVDNLRETVEELRGKGVRLVGDPGPGDGPITDFVCVHPSSACGVLVLLLER